MPIRISRIALALMLMTACSPPAPSPSGGGQLPIADARRRPLGATVTVEGVVTAPSGVIDAGFAMQDATGGIYVNADSATRIESFYRVQVTGTLVENHGLLGIAPTSVEMLGDSRAAPVEDVATGRIGEETEGRMVRATGTMTGPVADDRPYGWKLYIDDGSGPLLVFIPTGARIDVAGFRQGQRLRVTGFSGQYDDHHEILPLRQQDIEILAP